MGTQAVVSVTHNGETVIKAIAGCNGSAADHLADAIRTLPTLTVDEVYDAALRVGFGCPDCLVVMDATQARAPEPDELPPLYRETFADPTFNPRWRHGTAEYVVEVVDTRSE